MRFDPSGLVVACRRILERHPECGPLWWLCARLAVATDPVELAWEIADEIDRDPTAREVSAAVPDDATLVTIGWPDVAGAALCRRGDVHVLVVDSRHGASAFLQRLERSDVPCDPVQPEAVSHAVAAADVVVLEADAVSPDRAIVAVGGAAAAAVAARCGVPVWLVAGVGRRLPDEYLTAMIERTGTGRVPWELDHDVVELDAFDAVVGPGGSCRPADVAPECPFAPELLRASPI